MVSALLAVGVGFATKTYKNSVMYSEAQLLCQTLKNTISDELRFSEKVKEDNETFFSLNYGYGKLTKDSDGHLVFMGESGEITPLLSALAYTHNMKADVTLTYTPKTDDNGVKGLFSVELYVTDKDENTLAQSTFEVLQLNYQPSPA